MDSDEDKSLTGHDMTDGDSFDKDEIDYYYDFEKDAFSFLAPVSYFSNSDQNIATAIRMYCQLEGGSNGAQYAGSMDPGGKADFEIQIQNREKLSRERYSPVDCKGLVEFEECISNNCMKDCSIADYNASERSRVYDEAEVCDFNEGVDTKSLAQNICMDDYNKIIFDHNTKQFDEAVVVNSQEEFSEDSKPKEEIACLSDSARLHSSCSEPSKHRDTDVQVLDPHIFEVNLTANDCDFSSQKNKNGGDLNLTTSEMQLQDVETPGIYSYHDCIECDTPMVTLNCSERYNCSNRSDLCKMFICNRENQDDGSFHWNRENHSDDSDDSTKHCERNFQENEEHSQFVSLRSDYMSQRGISDWHMFSRNSVSSSSLRNISIPQYNLMRRYYNDSDLEQPLVALNRYTKMQLRRHAKKERKDAGLVMARDVPGYKGELSVPVEELIKFIDGPKKLHNQGQNHFAQRSVDSESDEKTGRKSKKKIISTAHRGSKTIKKSNKQNNCSDDNGKICAELTHEINANSTDQGNMSFNETICNSMKQETINNLTEKTKSIDRLVCYSVENCYITQGSIKNFNEANKQTSKQHLENKTSVQSISTLIADSRNYKFLNSLALSEDELQPMEESFTLVNKKKSKKNGQKRNDQKSVDKILSASVSDSLSFTNSHCVGGLPNGFSCNVSGKQSVLSAGASVDFCHSISSSFSSQRELKESFAEFGRTKCRESVISKSVSDCKSSIDQSNRKSKPSLTPVSKGTVNAHSEHTDNAKQWKTGKILRENKVNDRKTGRGVTMCSPLVFSGNELLSCKFIHNSETETCSLYDEQMTGSGADSSSDVSAVHLLNTADASTIYAPTQAFAEEVATPAVRSCPESSAKGLKGFSTQEAKLSSSSSSYKTQNSCLMKLNLSSSSLVIKEESFTEISKDTTKGELSGISVEYGIPSSEELKGHQAKEALYSTNVELVERKNSRKPAVLLDTRYDLNKHEFDHDLDISFGFDSDDVNVPLKTQEPSSLCIQNPDSFHNAYSPVPCDHIVRADEISMDVDSFRLMDTVEYKPQPYTGNQHAYKSALLVYPNGHIYPVTPVQFTNCIQPGICFTTPVGLPVGVVTPTVLSHSKSPMVNQSYGSGGDRSPTSFINTADSCEKIPVSSCKKLMAELITNRPFQRPSDASCQSQPSADCGSIGSKFDLSTARLFLHRAFEQVLINESHTTDPKFRVIRCLEELSSCPNHTSDT